MNGHDRPDLFGRPPYRPEPRPDDVAADSDLMRDALASYAMRLIIEHEASPADFGTPESRLASMVSEALQAARYEYRGRRRYDYSSQPLKNPDKGGW